jgi:hypothetical protein
MRICRRVTAAIQDRIGGLTQGGHQLADEPIHFRPLERGRHVVGFGQSALKLSDFWQQPRDQAFAHHDTRVVSVSFLVRKKHGRQNCFDLGLLCR